MPATTSGSKLHGTNSRLTYKLPLLVSPLEKQVASDEYSRFFSCVSPFVSKSALGYNEELWNAGAKIDTQTYSWDELSGEQQQAAFLVFGLTEQSWAGAALKNDEEAVRNKGGGRGGGRGGADDDYVFSVGDEEGNKNVWVSKYQIVYFVASVCFILVGVLGKSASLFFFNFPSWFCGF